MATKTATLQLILALLADVGEAALTEINSADLPFTIPALQGFTTLLHTELQLASGATDQAVSFTDAVGMFIVSDEPFKLRLAAGEEQLDNLRAWIVWADDTADGIHQTSVLLSGNGLTAANITTYIIEKP